MSSYTGVGFSDTTNVPEDLFLLNPSYQKMVTGRRNYRYMWSRFGCVGVLVTGFFIFMVTLMLPSFINEVRLLTLPTNTTEGRVVDTRISTGKSTTYYLTYNFTINNRQYQHEASISRSEYYARNLGDWVTVTYVKEDPTSSHLGIYSFDWQDFMPFIFVIAFFLIFGLVNYLSGRSRRVRVSRLRRNGRLIFGQLMASTGVEVRRGAGKSRRIDYDLTIYYQFVNPDQKRLDNQDTFVRNDLKKKQLQTRGSVAVLYISDEDFMVL